MDLQSISAFVMNNLTFTIACVGVLVVIMYAVIIYLYMSLATVKRNYRKLTTGVNGDNLEEVVMNCRDEIQRINEDNHQLDTEQRKIRALIERCLSRVAIVRFAAFEDIGSDLSYAVAMLDSYNNGVVFSSIYGRAESRSYVKPIKDGRSTYILTDEEQQALKEAMAQKID